MSLLSGWFKWLFLVNMPSLFFLKSTNNQLTAYSNTNPWMFKKHYFCLGELAAIQKPVHLFVSALKIFIHLEHGNQYAFSNLAVWILFQSLTKFVFCFLYLTQALLVHTLTVSCTDYCNSLLAGFFRDLRQTRTMTFRLFWILCGGFFRIHCPAGVFIGS